MHFAYPPRKSSNPPPFRPRSSNSLIRRSRLKTAALVLLTIVAVYWLLFSSSSSSSSPYEAHVPSGNPPVVIVTVIDSTAYSAIYLNSIKANREDYAAKHGYQAMVVKAYDYDTRGAAKSWAKIIALRHALSKYPDCKYLWFLDQDSYIMDYSKTLENQVTGSKKLESLMIKDHPIVPPDSIIKTFAHLKGDDAEFIVSQDNSGLVANSVVIRNGDWAKFFIETWMDPLYRSYNFQKAERHALEHIVQWHPTILSKLALVPQKTLASYTRGNLGSAYQDGDFVVMMAGCTKSGTTSCETEAKFYQKKLEVKYGGSQKQ